MQHFGTTELATDRLILRRFRLDDAEAMYRNWACDPEVTQFLTWPTHNNVGISEFILKEWIPAYDKPDYYQWAIVPKALNEPIGSISVVHHRDDIGMVHIGYCIGRPWWHQGYTSEALSGLIRFLFEEVGANRIEARHDPRNPHSGAVMLKCGLRLEGTMRQADKNNQGVCDYVMYGLLAEDYFRNQQAEAQND